jgi:pimeloyl-ACP methyl ester carboxylesterase
VDLGNNGDGTVFAKNAPESFYNDLEPETAEEFAKGNVTHNWGAALGPMTGAPWKYLPTTYVHCAQDMAIMHPLQQSMVQDAVNAGGKLIIETIDAGDCPFLSQPEEIVRIVESSVANVK